MSKVVPKREDMSEKIEAFVECLLGDIFGCFIEATGMDIELSTEVRERCVPDDFYSDIITFARIFIDELMPEMSVMPVLLCYNEDFFKRFTNSVCLKLINNDDPEVGFLKVMAFLLLITAMCFVHSCYRSLDDMPSILQKLLEEHIKTKFYEEDRFEAIASQCDMLKEDPKWYESTVEEMRTYIRDSLKTELAATKPPNCYQPDRIKVRMRDVRAHANVLCPDKGSCPYCCAKCVYLLKAFWKPKKMPKPGCQQM